MLEDASPAFPRGGAIRGDAHPRRLFHAYQLADGTVCKLLDYQRADRIAGRGVRDKYGFAVIPPADTVSVRKNVGYFYGDYIVFQFRFAPLPSGRGSRKRSSHGDITFTASSA